MKGINQMNTLAKISDIAAKYMSVFIIVVVLVAYYLPEYFAWLGGYLTILLGIVMFGMGLTLKASDFKIVLTKPLPVIIGMIAQYTIMPLSAFALAHLMNLPPALAAGLMLLGCVPGGTASNVMVYLARGDVALSIAMTSISTLIAPIMTPTLLLLLAGQWMPVDPVAMFMSIIQVIIIPIILGLLAKRLFPNIIEKSLAAVPLISIVAILIIGAAVMAGNAENIASAGILLFVAIIIQNMVGLALGYFLAYLCKLDYNKKKAVSLEVGMQNSALSAQLATVHLEPISALAGVGAAIWHQISGPIVASYWASKSKKHEDKTQVLKAAEQVASDTEEK